MSYKVDFPKKRSQLGSLQAVQVQLLIQKPLCYYHHSLEPARYLQVSKLACGKQAADMIHSLQTSKQACSIQGPPKGFGQDTTLQTNKSLMLTPQHRRFVPLDGPCTQSATVLPDLFSKEPEAAGVSLVAIQITFLK